MIGCYWQDTVCSEYILLTQEHRGCAGCAEARLLCCMCVVLKVKGGVKRKPDAHVFIFL